MSVHPHTSPDRTATIVLTVPLDKAQFIRTMAHAEWAVHKDNAWGDVCRYIVNVLHDQGK